MVDSYFGNISYRDGNTIYISQTGSSLDDLAGCIDPCPVDGSTCAAITASSEYSAHRDIYLGGERPRHTPRPPAFQRHHVDDLRKGKL